MFEQSKLDWEERMKKLEEEKRKQPLKQEEPEVVAGGDDKPVE